MATTMVEPFAPWLREFNQILHNQQHGTVNAFIPPADVLIDDDGVTVYMDVPGLRSENLEIELENDVLTVRGERAFPYAREDGSGPVRRIERGFGRFERTLRVPAGLDPEKVEASLADGVLTLRIPKPATLRPRRIEIRAHENGQHHDGSEQQPGQEGGPQQQGQEGGPQQQGQEGSRQQQGHEAAATS
jgi:HSP20 family protein